tara:strand:- start:124 stop:492 length:369 start_codon:yes stop_codon:yes gene_type:complete
MSSIGVKIPIVYNSEDGFAMLKTYTETIKQNLKMLILTNPGERVMEPEFGVGIKTFLFASFTENIQSDLNDRIHTQVSTYMPAISIDDITFTELDRDTNSMAFKIFYRIPNVGVKDLLEFTI